MKQTITNLSTVLLFASSGFSQVTITDAHAPSAGDAIVLSYDTLPILSIPASGTSQTWDYSGLAAHTMDTTTFQSSAGFTHIGDYPGSNLGMNEDGFEVFMTKNSSEFSYNGIAGPFFGGGDRYIYINPADVIARFPSNYNDSYVTNSFTYFSFPGTDVGAPVDSIVYVAHTTKTVNVDGWGSITTPYGTFDVLKIHTETVEIDTTYGYLFGFPQIFDDNNITSYSDGFWSDNANTRYPVLELEHNNVDSTFSSIWLNEAPLVATPEIAEIGASLYPNPAQDRLVIDVENVDISELELYDLTGELVEARAITPGKNEINVTNYQNGTYVYLLRLNNGDIGHSSRLIINR